MDFEQDTKREMKITLHSALCTLLVAAALTGCGTSYYLKRSEVNYRKAIFHGYKPSIDSVMKVDSKTFDIYSQRPSLALKIASFTDSVHTTDTVYMQTILTEYIEKELQGYCDMDTILYMADGSKVMVIITGGLLNVTLETYQKQPERVFVPEKKWTFKTTLGIIGSIYIGLLVIFGLIRLLRP